MPSIAWRFHPAIRFGCTPCLRASSETVSSPRIVSRATFALNSAVNRLRVVIEDRPSHASIHLSMIGGQLSRLSTEPHRHAGQCIGVVVRAAAGNGTCAHCGAPLPVSGKDAKFSVVHHKYSVAEHPILAVEGLNVEPLYSSCHSRRHAAERSS